jgi:hypothetical protein
MTIDDKKKRGRSVNKNGIGKCPKMGVMIVICHYISTTQVPP